MVAESPVKKSEELNGAILQAVAMGYHVVAEVETREYAAPMLHKYPVIKLRVYRAHNEDLPLDKVGGENGG